MIQNKKVKIVATLGPAIKDKADIRRLVENGANVFRLNFSHGEHADHAERLQWIRAVEQEMGTPIGILMDLQGPKLRVGKFADGAVILQKGQAFRLDLDNAPGDTTRASLPHPEIIEALKPGMNLLLDDGKLRLNVTAADAEGVDTEVLVGGELSDRKGVNVPEAVLELSPLTEKDHRDLQFGLEIGVDWVALSFVQKPEDIAEAKAIIQGRAFLMAKVEKPSAVEYLDEIVSQADAIMVARGDLGVELPAETIPAIQKRIVESCRQQGKPVVVATQMLESMRNSPAPTRAEVTDVANAVYEGADAVMLSAETASGDYPIEAVSMMRKIIHEVESDPNYLARLDINRPFPDATVSDAISCAIRRISRILPVAALVNYTQSGTTSLRAARERPKAPILSLTPSLTTARRLTVVWGIQSLVDESFSDCEHIVEAAFEAVEQREMADDGDMLVITAGAPFGRPGSTNMLRVETYESGKTA
ncbi:pyruvate kinase [Marinobacterium jannaschii]|uniref:pyruvate kinase n=1 Tax=Marinobacterium jannaschii TaxID=64970 RepID=UPI00048508CF|nr:pyruvate kinase [Marinobacterium jannaschii]